MSASSFYILFCDIGGVLGTNGWDTQLRHGVAERFQLTPHEIDSRHQLMFDSFERGFMTFDDYLRRVFFHTPRPFQLQEVRDCAFDGSVPWPENIALFDSVRRANGLKLGLISNEGQGLTEHRVKKFGLRNVADFLVVSHCVHMRKPDKQIWKLALDLAQATPEEAIYVDDREMFVQVAADLGFTAFQYTSIAQTRAEFQKLGLTVE